MAVRYSSRSARDTNNSASQSEQHCAERPNGLFCIAQVTDAAPGTSCNSSRPTYEFLKTETSYVNLEENADDKWKDLLPLCHEKGNCSIEARGLDTDLLSPDLLPLISSVHLHSLSSIKRAPQLNLGILTPRLIWSSLCFLLHEVCQLLRKGLRSWRLGHFAACYFQTPLKQGWGTQKYG